MGLSPLRIVLRYVTAIACCLSGIGVYGQSHDSRDLSAQVDEVVSAQIRE